MIEVLALSRRYGATVAVDSVSFDIGDNEIVGLLGHNGAGKTTIMRMLSGYLEPSAGTIAIGGIDIAEQPRLVQQELGYLPENLPIYPEMLVADYLEYAATIRGIPRGERFREVREAISATELDDRILDPIHTLSRGFRQRVGVAQAILGKPRLLILDEPTNGLDPRQTEHMRQLIRRLSRRATIILSTHIMQEVDAICDRVLMLRQGRLALDQHLQELRANAPLLLETDTAVDSLPGLLEKLPQVESLARLEDAGGNARFEITLYPGASPETAASNIARCAVEAGARLYQLGTARRDLDSVFREVNADGE